MYIVYIVTKKYHFRSLNFLSFNCEHFGYWKMAPQQKVQKVMVQPINLIFRCLQSRSRVQIWLYDNAVNRIEGYIIGMSIFNM